jgi:hypothetical protein
MVSTTTLWVLPMEGERIMGEGSCCDGPCRLKWREG